MSLSDSYSSASSIGDFGEDMVEALKLAERLNEAAQQEKNGAASIGSSDQHVASGSALSGSAAPPDDFAATEGFYRVSEGLMMFLRVNSDECPPEFHEELQLWASDAWNRLIDPPEELEAWMYVACFRFIPCNSMRLIKMVSAANSLKVAKTCSATGSHAETVARWKELLQQFTTPDVMPGVIGSAFLNFALMADNWAVMLRSSIRASYAAASLTAEKCQQTKQQIEDGDESDENMKL
jgi:hypothetical protein